MSSATARLLVAAAAARLLASCGGGATAVFHVSDPSFRPAPAARPPVYLPADLTAVPRVRMRSVGIIEVALPARSGIEAAAEVAADKGRELGCWILVEHGAFARVRARASLAYGARVRLAHGGIGHVSHSSPRGSGRQQKVQFDCVLRAADA